MASLLLGAVPMALSLNLSFSRSLSISGASVSATSSASVYTDVTFANFPSIYCGRGDKKTAKGKRFNHSFGNARPRNKKGRGPPRVAAPPAAPKRDPFDDGQIVKIEIVES
ncbi:small ribosomal subunit protein bTHXc-like [Nicotiana tabacum]|uniref:30S ribosomal protein S31, chloroplastic-like n=1 Tax=Nicotiana tabacum TaxID=4097 RepID=A0A1S4CIR6_TOBAC|nr:PREDICTED: 30S ribosomal protein S31, chloroplastic-like [Nicotiana tabacum]